MFWPLGHDRQEGGAKYLIMTKERLILASSPNPPWELFFIRGRNMMEQKGMTFDHDFYVVVGKQCRTENVYEGHQLNILTIYI